MIRTRIKFCGITRIEDALHAVHLGVDAIGLVFARVSPRCVTIDQARTIIAALPPLVGVVALFLDDTATLIREVEHRVRPTLLQFHGTEPDAFCSDFDTPFVKGIAMKSMAANPAWTTDYPHARGFLLDGHLAGERGGQGTAFDWSTVPSETGKPVILAGGLDAANVAVAIGRVRPWAVDVSSGIEVAPGIKSLDKMQAFVKAVQSTYKT